MEQNKGTGVNALDVIERLKLVVGNLQGEAAVNAVVIESQRDEINALNQKVAQLESELSDDVAVVDKPK